MSGERKVVRRGTRDYGEMTVDREDYADGTHSLNIRCKCGKPITVSNGLGMFCEDRCGEEESRAAQDQVAQIADGFGDLFAGLGDLIRRRS